MHFLIEIEIICEGILCSELRSDGKCRDVFAALAIQNIVDFATHLLAPRVNYGHEPSGTNSPIT